ncbi:hypothetical protein SDC9_204253 [bioreactor metagenome]|uniref:Uncharacterized protein n=1 Tax=bioreactor metagenome TaxID=1076179 RepID=A0A645JAM6_9ZZZZ
MTNSNVYILTPFAHGIKKTETAGVGTVSPLIITSDSAFVKDKESTSAEKETGNEEGPFYVGALTSNKDTGSKFIWYSSPFILTNAYSNLEFFMSSVSLLCEKTSSISILSKRLSSEYLLLTEGQYTLWSVVFTLVIPLAVIVIGLSIWLRRRKK